MLKAQEVIKDKFWIVNHKHGKVGTLRKISENKYEFFDLRINDKTYHDSLSEFDITDSTRDSDSNLMDGDIKGWPTGVPEPIEIAHEVLPTFKKKETQQTIYCAGWYVLEFHGMGWQGAFVPKLQTLTKYNYKGPFLTEWEMNLELRRVKRGSLDVKENNMDSS